MSILLKQPQLLKKEKKRFLCESFEAVQISHKLQVQLISYSAHSGCTLGNFQPAHAGPSFTAQFLCSPALEDVSTVSHWEAGLWEALAKVSKEAGQERRRGFLSLSVSVLSLMHVANLTIHVQTL